MFKIFTVDELCLWLSLLLEITWICLRGSASLIHCSLCSAYGGPIDPSPWSMTFCALSFGKEIAFIIMVISGLPVIFGDFAGDLKFSHTLLLGFLTIIIIENKMVSPDVKVLRNNFCLYLNISLSAVSNRLSFYSI